MANITKQCDTKQNDSTYNECIMIKSNPPNITGKHIWSADQMRDALLESLFCRISEETILHIFKLLFYSDLCNVSLVCRQFKMIADKDEI
jgi:hypothetical protein